MSTMADPGLGPFDPGILRRSWGWFLVLGILEIVLGTIAVGASTVATVATVVLYHQVYFDRRSLLPDKLANTIFGS